MLLTDLNLMMLAETAFLPRINEQFKSVYAKGEAASTGSAKAVVKKPKSGSIISKRRHHLVRHLVFENYFTLQRKGMTKKTKRCCANLILRTKKTRVDRLSACCVGLMTRLPNFPVSQERKQDEKVQFRQNLSKIVSTQSKVPLCIH